MTTVSVTLAAEQLRRRVPGGIGTYARGLLKGLGELPADERPLLTIVASRPRARPDPLAAFGFPLACSRLPGPLLTRLWDRGLMSAGRGTDVVHSVSSAAPLPASGVFLVVTLHDVAWRSMPAAYPARGRRWHEEALRRAAARAAVVVVPSEATGAAVIGAGVGIAADRVVVVPEGADHLAEPDGPAAQALLEELGVTGPYLLTVSTLEPRKNLERLVRAYGLARCKLPESWPLVVVGPSGWGPSVGPGPSRDLGGSASRGAGAATGGVVFAGEVDGGILAALYRGARCCAYVPILEGFGLPAVEAMMQGTPVVSSPVPSTGGASLEVDPSDIESIADGLVTAACDEAARTELVARGHARAAALRWVDAARAHASLWERLAGERRRTR